MHMSGRTPTPAAFRIRNRLWAWMLFGIAKSSLVDSAEETTITWAWLAEKITAGMPGGSSKISRFQGLERVAKNGEDPRNTHRYIAESEWEEAKITALDAKKISTRANIKYAQVRIDLVARSESCFPGSAAWYNTPFWKLLFDSQISHREVNEICETLQKRLGLYQPVLSSDASEEDLAAMAAFSYIAASGNTKIDALIDRYKAPFAGMISDPSPDELALLAGYMRLLCPALPNSPEFFGVWNVSNPLLLDIHLDLLLTAIGALKKRCFENEIVESLIHLTLETFEKSLDEFSLPDLPLSLALPLMHRTTTPRNDADT